MDSLFSNRNSSNNDVLLLLDGSYCCYFCAYSAVSRWRSQYYETGLETIRLPEPGSIPYDELPDLVNDTIHFKRVLFDVAVEKLEIINNIVLETTGHFFSNATDENHVDTILARDSHAQGQFRRVLYPEYKMQRAAARAESNDFNHWKIFEYIYDVVFPQILPHNNTYSIKIPEAEGDDIIAAAVKSEKLKQKYHQVILIASDHDFCQLHRPENRIRQFTLKGEQVECTFQITRSGQKQILKITPDQALMIKIITGDSSDNIPGIKKRLGPVGAWKLLTEGDAKENLRKLFAEDKDAALAFQRNRKLIDFNEIPQDVQDIIIAAIMKNVG